MSGGERTTKYVTTTLKLTFHGDYIGAEDIEQYLTGWLGHGLSDRDDLYGWKMTIDKVDERTGDPEGYDQ